MSPSTAKKELETAVYTGDFSRFANGANPKAQSDAVEKETMGDRYELLEKDFQKIRNLSGLANYCHQVAAQGYLLPLLGNCGFHYQHYAQSYRSRHLYHFIEAA